MDDEQPRPAVFAGKVETVEASSLGQYAAVLWVPDPEQRRGWREYYVKHGEPSKPGARERMGFGHA
jgi:hypothetical protein